MLRIKNTALEPSKALLLRNNPRLEMEPLIMGTRLRLRTSIDVPDEWVLKNKAILEPLIKGGIIEISYSTQPEPEPAVNAAGLKLGGPTLERWMEAGYQAEGYPPSGWAEIPSAGLTAYRKGLEEAAAQKAEEQRKGYEELKAREEADRATKKAAEEAAAALEEHRKLEMSEQVVPAETLVTTTTEPVAPPVSTPPAAPAVEEKSDSKKGPGKKKLF